MQYRFGHHTLDLDTVELRCDGEPVELEPRSFAVLCHLVDQRHRVVPKHELLDEVWGDRFVSESALTTRIKDCRRALGDDGRTQGVIKTVHRVGYRFVAEVDADVTPHPASSPPTTAPREVSPAWAAGAAAKLFGRDRELEDLSERLRTHRIVTVTGPGGVGKSRLAAAHFDVADAAVTDPADGEIWTCDLTTTRDPGALGEVVLGALGERQQSDADPLTTIRRVTAGREGVVVLDNCEHLLDAIRPVVESLTAGNGVRVLATSRSPMQVPGETVMVLDPLDAEAAVACFGARATDIGAHVDAADPAVVELCERLDRLPLALELAASRTRLLAPAQILELLDDRFRLLRRDDIGDPDPHDSLAATIGWSWDLLDPDGQELLCQLSAFVGPFSLEDAAGVAKPDGDVLDVIDGLDRLIRASMLVAVPVAGGGRRFRLLESIREFAADHLADPRGLGTRHAAHYARLVERLDAQLRTDHVDEALGAMAAAWPNIRAAVEHAATTGDHDTTRRIIRAVGVHADLYQAFEVIEWCERAGLLDAEGELAADGSPDLVADALAIWARLLAHRGDLDRAATLAGIADERARSFTTQLSLIWVNYYQGDLDRVVDGAATLEALTGATAGVDQAYADGFSAIVAAVRQDPVLSTTDVTPSDVGDGVLGTLRCLTAGFRLCAADPHRASELLEAVVTSSLRNDYRLLLGAAASTLTQITLPGRPRAEAMTTLCRTLGRYLERGMWPLISADTVMAATLLADSGDEETAGRLLGARMASGYRVGLSEVGRAMLDARLRTSLGDRLDLLVAEGSAWSPPHAGEVAVAAMRDHLARLS